MRVRLSNVRDEQCSRGVIEFFCQQLTLNPKLRQLRISRALQG